MGDVYSGPTSQPGVPAPDPSMWPRSGQQQGVLSGNPLDVVNIALRVKQLQQQMQSGAGAAASSQDASSMSATPLMDAMEQHTADFIAGIANLHGV